MNFKFYIIFYTFFEKFSEFFLVKLNKADLIQIIKFLRKINSNKTKTRTELVDTHKAVAHSL